MALTSSLMHHLAKVDRRERCAMLGKDRETSPQVHLDFRRKNDGEASGRDRHMWWRPFVSDRARRGTRGMAG